MNVWRAFYPITQNHKLLIKVLKETSQLSQVLISHFSLLFSCSLLVLFSHFIYFSLKLHSPSPFLLLPPSPLHTAPAWSSCSGLWRHITRRAEPYDSWGKIMRGLKNFLKWIFSKVLNIYELDPSEEEFLLGERETRRGKVPR